MDETEGTPGPWLARLSPARIAGRAAMRAGSSGCRTECSPSCSPGASMSSATRQGGTRSLSTRRCSSSTAFPGSLALGLTSVGLLGIVAQLPRRSSFVAQSTSTLVALVFILGGASLVGMIRPASGRRAWLAYRPAPVGSLWRLSSSSVASGARLAVGDARAGGLVHCALRHRLAGCRFPTLAGGELPAGKHAPAVG